MSTKTPGRVVGESSWRGFDHDALTNAVSSDLAEAGWLQTPVSPSEGPGDVVQVAGDALLASLFKKWSVEASRAEDRALLTFLEANHLSRKWVLPVEFSFNGRFATLFERIRWELYKFLHPNGNQLFDSYDSLWENGYSGPGASIGARGYSFYAKHGASKVSASSEDLYMLYRGYTSRFPLWAEAESLRTSMVGMLSVAETSNVSFAPKNANTARLICTEPSINMFAQLGLKVLLDRRLSECFGLDMEDQPEINRLLAKWGSRGEGFGTLDLASASDSVSVELCRLLLPEWFFQTLLELRSKATLVRSHGLCVDLGMIGTMGNGFTFPVMTLILSCVVRAVYDHVGIPIRDTRRVFTHRAGYDPKGYNLIGNWAVFGDDIIVRSDAYDVLVEVLGLLGFSVNLSKSFNTGPFRESCGHDYYHGLNVRGVYLKRMTSLQDLAVAVNLLNQWSAQTGIGLSRAVRYLMSLFRDNKVLYVPYAMPLDSGIRVPLELVPDSCRRTRKGERHAYRTCFKAWTMSPAKVKFGDGVVMTPSGSRRLGYNAHALLMSFLLGEVRDGQISIRQNNASLYRTQWHETPNWDYVPPSYWFNHQYDWRRFVSAVYWNLFQ